MAKSGTPRIQFTLRDLLLVMGLTGFALFLANRVSLAKSSASFGLSPVACIVISLLTICGAAVGVFWSRKDPLTRGYYIFGWVCTFWVVGGVATAVIATETQPISRGETGSAACCKAFAEAEEIYHRTDYSHSGVLQYAKSLQELVGPKGALGLVDKTFGQAELGRPYSTPKWGFFFKVLTAQGPYASGGRRSYIDEKGNMTRGYALIACPAQYVPNEGYYSKSYMINSSGTIFEKDLGPDGIATVEKMTEFDPDSTWEPTH